jgi:mono/diheme cytochrome c family protein
MNQVKYLIYASLLIAFGFVSISFLSKVYNTFLVNTNSSVVIDPDSATASVPTSKGKTLFQQNCQSCHALDKNLTGPALRGFTERGPWNDKKNIYEWVKTPAAFMQNDKYSQDLKVEYGVIMPAFPNLTIEDVDAIVGYVSTPISGY